MSAKAYTVTLSGCDDSTSFSFEFTDEQYALVASLCEASERESTYGCMPVMRVVEAAR